MSTDQERIAALEVKTDYQELHLTKHDKDIEELQDLKFIVQNLVESVKITNDSITKVNVKTKEIEDRQEKLENAPKEAVYEVVTDGAKSIIKKVLPWILVAGLVTGGVAVYNTVTDKSTDTPAKVEKLINQ